MEIQLKPIAIQHIQDVQRLSGQLGYPLSVNEIEDNITEVISNKDHIAFVVLNNEKVIAWIHAFRAIFLESKPFVEIGGLIVDENYRGKGIGKQLIKRIKEWSLEKGIGSIRVRCNIRRKEAHQFYLNIGFDEIKEQKVFQMNL
jgi:GNAT superfamily N-acetyltransferase